MTSRVSNSTSGNAARAFATGSTDRVVVRDQRGRALLVDELGVPVDRVVDARRTATGAGDVFVTVDDRTMREEQLALFPAHPTPPAAAPPAGFRVIAAHDGWRALAGPACR